MDKEGEQRVKKSFGARVRQLRKARGLSQEALAFDCGLDRSYLGSIERGERNLAIVNVHRIADALKVKPGELFGE
jgi:transcriptional regulator with XRE-family HTH domain